MTKKNKKILTIGGGNGQFVLLAGLRDIKEIWLETRLWVRSPQLVSGLTVHLMYFMPVISIYYSDARIGRELKFGLRPEVSIPP